MKEVNIVTVVLVLLAVAAGIATLGLASWIHGRSAGRLGAISVVVLSAYALAWWFRPRQWWLGSALVVAVSALVANWLAGRLVVRGALMTFAVVAALADIASFYAGPTKWLLEGQNRAWVVSLVAVCLPVGKHVFAVVGIGDLAVLGASTLGLRQNGRSWAEASGVPLAGLLAAVAAGLVSSRGMPGVAFMGFLALIDCIVRGRAPKTSFQRMSGLACGQPCRR